MTQNRRDFIKSSTAVTLLTVSSASAAPATRTIGIFHTTQISPEELACFQAGLGSDWTPDKKGEAKGKYGGSVGYSELSKYIKDNVDVFVAAGGVTSQVFAKNNLGDPQSPPFVYMSGLPASPASAPDGKYCGVILNVPARYSDALSNFSGLGINDNIWLIQNYNAAMTRGELAQWGYNKPSFRFFESSTPIDNPDPSNSTAVQTAYIKEWARFLSLYPRPSGLIINPDPYFRLTAIDFKVALRSSLKNTPVVCYPFSDYSLSSPDFYLPNRVMLSSSSTQDHNNAYWRLGSLTAALLNSSPGSSVASVKWDGANWVPA